jgi:SM-20-related protein
MILRYLDIDAFRKVPLATEPFQYLVVPGFVRPEAAAKIIRDYPVIAESGSFPVAQVSYGPAFREFLDEMEADEFREAFEEKFGLDLSGRPTTITVRGRCSPKDGRIHTDTKSKIITILIYLNGEWEHPGGRLRLLRSADDLENMILEVPPNQGTLLAFRRAENSWHGHKPFSGERRVIQFNWVTSEGDRRIAMLRHNVSAPLKRLFAAMLPNRPSSEKRETARRM